MRAKPNTTTALVTVSNVGTLDSVSCKSCRSEIYDIIPFVRLGVVYGTHPDEMEALEVGESLVINPIPNTYPIAANLWAIQEGVRFIDVNMAMAYPGRLNSPYYEERRAVKVMEEVAALDLDAVIDLHSISSGKKHAVLNPAMGLSPVMLGALKKFGIQDIVLCDFGLCSYFHNSCSVEISSEEVATYGIGFVREFFANLANEPDPPYARATDFSWFKYSQVGGGGLHQSIIHPNDFTPEERAAYGSFLPLPPRIQRLLDSPVTLYAQNDLRLPNAQGYFTDLFEMTTTPDDNNWPR